MRVNSTYLSTEKEKVSKFCEQCANWQPRYDIRHEMPLHVSKSKRCDTLILRICQSGCRIFIICPSFFKACMYCLFITPFLRCQRQCKIIKGMEAGRRVAERARAAAYIYISSALSLQIQNNHCNWKF